MTPTAPPETSVNEMQEVVQELEKFRQIVETATEAVVTINQNHEVVFMNAAAERMFGYQREEVLGGDLAPLIPSEHRAKHKGFVRRYLRTCEPRLIGHQAELTAERRDGSRFPISISFSVAETNSGLLFTASMRDLSAEHEMAEQVKQAEKLAAVGEMVATVSHEIRTPLTLIGGFAKQLSREKNLSQRGRRKVAIIQDEVARLESMLHELNDLSRTQRYNWQELRLGQVVDQVRELMAPGLKRDRFFLKVKKARGLPKVVADRDRLSQVVINLVTNAAQASGPGDELVMELAPGEDGWVRLMVRDFGCGMSPEVQQQLFDTFFTTKKRGTGLGLPLARRIINEHGGTISVKSSPGAGTTMTVNLPPAPHRPGSSEPQPPPPPERP